MTTHTDVPGLGQGRGCHADEVPSLAELFAAHHDRLLRTGAILTDDVAAAERIVESAFGTVARRRRRRRRAPDPASTLAQLYAAVLAGARSAGTPTPGTDGLSADDASVLAALPHLPAHQREVLVLHYWAGLSEVEIGEVLAEEPEAVCALAYRGLSTLTHDLGRRDPAATEERLYAALQARADRVPAAPVPLPTQAVEEPGASVPRAAARWLPVGVTAALVCTVMAAVAAFSAGGPRADRRPDADRTPDPPAKVIRRSGLDLTVANERLRFAVPMPIATAVRQPMPVGGGICYAFDYPMQADGRVDPSIEMYAAGGCRGGLVVAPRVMATDRTEPVAKTSAHVRLGPCRSVEQDLVVTARGLTAEHAVYECAVGPVEEWAFRDDVVWSLDGGSRMAAIVGQAGPAAATVGAGG